MDVSAISPSSPFNMFMVHIETVVLHGVEDDGSERCLCDRGRLELDLKNRTAKLFDRRNDRSTFMFHLSMIASGKTGWITRSKKNPTNKAAKFTLWMHKTKKGDSLTIIIRMNRLDAIRFHANFLPAYYVAIGRI
jgi:hypothetical protein